MARPNKIGLDYFPLDVDFFNDEKIGAISGEFGIKGELACIKLLCAIYRQGYFILWNEMLQMKLIKELPGVSADLLNSIVSRLVRWGFFDKTLFDQSGILTSNGIQRRYFEIIHRRKTDGDLPYLLVNVYNNPVNVCKNTGSGVVNVNINAQRKEKERKVNNTPLPPKGECECKKSIFDSSNATESLNHQEKEKEKSCAKKEKDFCFDDVWALYGRKGNRKTSERRWANLKNHCREAAWKHIPLYVASTPDIQFRKNFESYLNQECWNDEIIKKQSKNESNSRVFIPEGIVYEGDTI